MRIFPSGDDFVSYMILGLIMLVAIIALIWLLIFGARREAESQTAVPIAIKKGA